MKRLFLYLSLLAALTAWTLPTATADDTDSKPAPTKKADIKAKTDKKAMAKAVKKLKPMNGKISSTAKYVLIYHISAVESICEEPLEQLVEAAKDMKKAKMDVLLISQDKDAALTQKFVKEKKATHFALVMASNPLLKPDDEQSTAPAKKDKKDKKDKKSKKDDAEEEVLPGFNVKDKTGHVVILDSAGEELAAGNSELIGKWQDYVEDTKADSKTEDAAE